MEQRRSVGAVEGRKLQFARLDFLARNWRGRLKIGGTFGGTERRHEVSLRQFVFKFGADEHLRLIRHKRTSAEVSHSRALVGAVPSACFLRISPLVCRATVFTSSLPTQYCSVRSVTRTSQALPASSGR